MRKIGYLLLAVACIAAFEQSAGAVTFDLDLALWKFFKVKLTDVNTNTSFFYNRGVLQFVPINKAAVTDLPVIDPTKDPSRSDALAVSVSLPGKATPDYYFWKDHQYILCKTPVVNTTSGFVTCKAADLDVKKTLSFEKDQTAFKKFVTMWGALWAPSMLSPAKSLGHSGFSAEFESSLNFMANADDPAWGTGFYGFDPYKKDKPTDGKSFLPMLGLRLVKGLPFSTELGVAFKYLTPSRAFSVGTDVKVAFYEGYQGLPDVAFRFHYAHVFGSTDLSTDIFGGDLSVDYTLKLLGLLDVTPYAGYSLMGVYAKPQVVNASFHSFTREQGCVITDVNNNLGYCADYDGFLLKLDSQWAALNRIFLGTRVELEGFIWTFEYVFTGNGSFSPQGHQINIGVGGLL